MSSGMMTVGRTVADDRSAVGPSARLLSLPRANNGAARWHVSPLIDVTAYHFSWLWALLPLLALPDRHPDDYLALYVMVMAVNFTHRHFSLPYVYLDAQVFAQHKVWFTVVPLLAIAAVLASASLWQYPGGRAAVSAIAFVAVLWNVWHVFMQKYGILRLYNAKARLNTDGVARWVDRWLVLGWVPLYAVYLGPANRGLLVEQAGSINAYLLPIVDALATARPVLLLPATACVIASLATFVMHERRAFGLRNVPRLSMAAGTTLLGASFLAVNPIKVYLAYAFSHAVEYMVFVWAFQRRRYRGPTTQPTMLARLLRRPWLFYASLLVVVCGGYLVFRHWGQYGLPGQAPLVIGGTSAVRWIFFWAIYQSLMHFHYDGFLWRMRTSQVRRSI